MEFFGKETDSTVRGFQHALSLDIPFVVVDGIVGPITWQALVGGMLSGVTREPRMAEPKDGRVADKAFQEARGITAGRIVWQGMIDRDVDAVTSAQTAP